MESDYTARFYDIIVNERIVYVYDMHIRGGHHSVALAAVELTPESGGTKLVYTEQTAWLDGTNRVEGVASRERGVGWHLDNLAGVLRHAG